MSSHAQPLVPARSAVSLAWPAALALAALMGIGRFAFTPVWPLMAHDAALSLEQGGWLASANYAGYLLGALIAAAWPPRRPLAALGASLLAVAALTLAMPLPHSVAGWAALRLAAGWPARWASSAWPHGGPRGRATRSSRPRPPWSMRAWAPASRRPGWPAWP